MLLLVLSSIIFFTQQEIVQKILAFGTGVATQLALIPKIFGKEKEQNQKSEIRITDQQGKQVYNQQVNTLQGANQYAINIAYLSKGVYYLQLLTDNGSSSVKFIKN